LPFSDERPRLLILNPAAGTSETCRPNEIPSSLTGYCTVAADQPIFLSQKYLPLLSQTHDASSSPGQISRRSHALQPSLPAYYPGGDRKSVGEGKSGGTGGRR